MNIKCGLFMVLMSIGLTGCVKAQIGKQIVNLDNLNYDFDVAHYYAGATEQNANTNFLDHVGKGLWIFYTKDTLKYYNIETDEPYPSLISYNQSGEAIKEATFDDFDFYKLDIVATTDNKWVFIHTGTELSETEFAKLKSDLDKKHGGPCLEDIQENETSFQKWRWETKDEYIQLQAEKKKGKETVVTKSKGNSAQPVLMKNPDPYIYVVLYKWQKKYHDLVLINYNSISFDKEKEKTDSFHAISSELYTPKVIKPFLITTHFLDSLESGDVYSQIEASFYHRIPNNQIIDKTGISNTMEINKEGYLPFGSFDVLIKNHKDGLSNKQYMIQQMQKGVKFAQLMTDKRLCRKGYFGEAVWKEKKNIAGLVFLTQDDKGNMLLENTDKIDYKTMYDQAMRVNDTLKKELQNSGLKLEKTTACYINFPGESNMAAFFTDGALELFTFIGNPGEGVITGDQLWEADHLYPVISYLKEEGRKITTRKYTEKVP